MADGLTSSEAPFQFEPLKSADSRQMKAADDGSENVNKQGFGENPTPNTTEMMYLENGIISRTDNTCNNNAHTVSSSITQSQETEPAETEQLGSVSYKNITTMSNEIPFHPAVNGPSNNQKQHNDPVKKTRRGISFPKDTFILGSLEPPDPWKNAPSWTTDDLIAAYRKSCDVHGAKPSTKVLQQLSAITTPGRREEQFVLKGERLDHKQCECLEEVLKRVQFKLVDLEACHLDDECAGALFDMIEYYESACQLIISCNKDIGARGWQAASRLVRRTPTLTFLDIRGCDMNDRTIPIFGRALKLGCHLTILHMEKMTLSGRPLIILGAALKQNETLQELFLADNKLMPTDGVQLGNLLRYNHRLSLLDLRNNHLQDVGTSHICEGLKEQTKGRGLRTLVLWNNQLTYQAMPALGRALGASESMETVNIGHNTITNEGVHLLKDGLLKTCTLLRLGLQGTKISDEGAVALAEFLADSLILLRIDLRDNDIKTGGLMALSHAMRVNTSVTRIDLDKENKKESGMKDYAEQQQRLQRDIVTFQQRNIQSAMEREEAEREKMEERAEEALRRRAEEEEAASKQTEESSSGSTNESFTVISQEDLATGEGEIHGKTTVSQQGESSTEAASTPDTAAETSRSTAVPPIQPNGEHAQNGVDTDEVQSSDVVTGAPVASGSVLDDAIQSMNVESSSDELDPNCCDDSLAVASSSDSVNENGFSEPFSEKVDISSHDASPDVSHDASHDLSNAQSPERGFNPAARQHHTRPSNLFTAAAHPQALLDSPMPRSAGDQDSIGQPLTPSPPLPSPSSHFSPPSGDMLLSPQYYPKQLARKIFSVSRVSDDDISACTSPSSPSPLSHSSPEDFALLNNSSADSINPFFKSDGDRPADPTTLDPSALGSLVRNLASESHADDPDLNCDSLTSTDEYISSASTDRFTAPLGEDSNKSESDISISNDSSEQGEVAQGSEVDDSVISNLSSGPSSLLNHSLTSSDEDACTDHPGSPDPTMAWQPSPDPAAISVLPAGIFSSKDSVAVLPMSTDLNGLVNTNLDFTDNLPEGNPQGSNNAMMTSMSAPGSSTDDTHTDDTLTDDCTDTPPTLSDTVDISHTDLSLEDEPWLTLDPSDPSLDLQGSEKQPDFFTTLTSNGLTQELASALTSLEGGVASDGRPEVCTEAGGATEEGEGAALLEDATDS